MLAFCPAFTLFTSTQRAVAESGEFALLSSCRDVELREFVVDIAGMGAVGEIFTVGR